MDIKQQFQEALKRIEAIKNNPPEAKKGKPSNQDLLQLYSLYKQSTDGDVNGKKPGMFDFVGQAKYHAWKGLKGMGKEEAMQKYVDYVNELFAKFG